MDLSKLKLEFFIKVFLLILAITIVLDFVIPVGEVQVNCPQGLSCPGNQPLYLLNSNPSISVLAFIGLTNILVSLVLSIIITFIAKIFF